MGSEKLQSAYPYDSSALNEWRIGVNMLVFDFQMKEVTGMSSSGMFDLSKPLSE
jgi:hypothetical protein